MKGPIIWGLLLSLSSTVYASPNPRPRLDPPTPNAVPKPGTPEHTVTLGKAQHAFEPSELNATVGDIIRFQFFSGKHSVTKGVFGYACNPWKHVYRGEDNVWSGLIEAREDTTNIREWLYEVTSQSPTFFYCSAEKSCKGQGMVFALNPNGTQTWEEYRNSSINAEYQVSPGEPPPSEGGKPPLEGGEPPKEDKLSIGAIAGIVIGAVAAIALVGLLFFYIGHKKAEEKPPQSTVQIPAPSADGVGPYSDLPPGYDKRFSAATHFGGSPPMQQTGWESKPPLSPTPQQGAFTSPHESMYGQPSPNTNHMSWAPSELGGESTTPKPVEIYTPGMYHETATSSDTYNGTAGSSGHA